MARFLVALAMVVAMLAFVAVGEVQATTGTVGACRGIVNLGGTLNLTGTVYLGNGIVDPVSQLITRPINGTIEPTVGDEYGVTGIIRIDPTTAGQTIIATGSTPRGSPYSFIIKAWGSGSDPTTGGLVMINGDALMLFRDGGPVQTSTMINWVCQQATDP